MGQLMEMIQEVSRGQEIMQNMQEDMNQHANAYNLSIPLVVETLIPHSHVDPPVHIGTPDDVLPVNIHPSVVEVDDQHDAFFSPRDAFQYDAFGPATNEVEKKVRTTEEKLKADECTNALGFDADEMCLVPGVIIPAKFKFPEFERYKGTSDPITHIIGYCRKMASYSNDNLLLMHFFQDSLSGTSLDWYM